MHLRLQRYLVFFLLIVSQSLLAQKTAKYQVIQSTVNDTLYLDFQIQRTSIPQFDLGGYNIVFTIDTSVVDTANARIFNQGLYGNKPAQYSPLRLYHLAGLNYQITLYKNPSGAGTSLVPDVFVSVGKVGFKVKRCGLSNISFTTVPSTTIAGWENGTVANVTETGVPPSSIKLSTKTNVKLLVAKDTVCKNGTDAFTLSKGGFSNYSLYIKNTSGAATLISGPQASISFSGISIATSNQYFIQFQSGTNNACTDTSSIERVVAVDPPVQPVINTITSPICLGQKVTFNTTIGNTNNKYIWKLIPSTLAKFDDLPSGRGKNTVRVDFQGTNPYSVQLSVQDTNKFGCASIPGSITLNPVKCNLTADFAINGSDTSISSCQNASVSYTDKSSSSSGSIVKWSWNFGAGAMPDTSNLKNPAPVVYTSAGIVNVKLTVTDNNGLTKTIVKSPTVKVLSVLSQKPDPSCGSSSCNEVNFNWPGIPEATSYKVRYKKGIKGTFTNFQTIGLASDYTVNKSSPGMGGSLEFSDTKNDTVYFQVKAIAGKCDSTLSGIVFCRPSYCSVLPGCNLPAIKIPTPPTYCVGANAKITVQTTPNTFYKQSPYKSVRFVWENGGFDTSHSHTIKITTEGFQKVKLLTVDTLLPNCYSLNSISIPVGKSLITKPDLGIQSLECDRATFVWKHVDGADKYQIRYSGTCVGFQDWTDAPLAGQAEFFEVTGLTNGCNINFQVRAIGACNQTQSDTLISPPTCSCYIGHISSSNAKTCALDTLTLKISNIQVPNWKITWFDPVKNISVSSTTDTTYRFVPSQTNTIYAIKYTLYDLTKKDSCITSGYIYDTTSTSTSPEWSPVKTSFCISDVIYYLNDKAVNPGYQFSGNGINQYNDAFYFDPKKAGLGKHLLTYNACGNKEDHEVLVVDRPCVTTVVGGGNLIKNANDLYTACDGTIYITDETSIWKYAANATNGIPQLIAKTSSSGDLDGNISAALFGKPYGIVLDETTANELYFADYDKHKIRRIVFDKSRIETVAGQNVAGNNPNNNTSITGLASARFFNPLGLAIHPNSDTLYVSDFTTNSIKSFTFKNGSPQIKLLLGNPSGIPLPGKGKAVNIRPRRIAVDSLGLSFTDEDGFIGRYTYSTDLANASTVLTQKGYKDGSPLQYLLRSVAGVTPRIGDWIFFTDKDNYALRRVNAVTGYMETVAGSPPQNGPPSNFPPLADGSAFNARFSVPTALSFNIKGYIDVLDAGSPVSVRRFYIPRWGVGTWDGFDTTYIANCDRDTVTPIYSSGTLRIVKGDQNALIGQTIFAPKLTGTYLLAYKIRVGRCDTTFFKTVVVRRPPKTALKNDTTCYPTAQLTAVDSLDLSLKYKWFGPDVRTLLLADTTRKINVSKTGKYWVEVYYGKGNKCFLTDSAKIRIIKSQVGIINTASPKSGPNEATVCYGGNVTLSMDQISPSAAKFKSILWSTGESTKTIVASGSANYVATARDTLGCDIIAKFKVIQQPLPAICIKVTDATTGKNLGWGGYRVSTFAGTVGVSGGTNGKGTNATFKFPWGLAIYKDTLYVSDKNNKIRSISLADANVADFLGNGSNLVVDSVNQKSKIAFNTPQGFRFDKAGNLYVANTGASNIAKYDRTKNLYYILAGSGNTSYKDSTGKLADLNQPYDVEIDAAGNLFFTDNQNHAIRSIDYQRKVRTLAGTPPNFGNVDGKGRNASFNWPWGITINPTGEIVVSEDANHTLRRIGLDTNVTLVAGAFKTSGSNSAVVGKAIQGLAARFNRPSNLASDNSGNTYITDGANNLVRVLDTKGNVTTLAGQQGISGNVDGSADSATFSNLTGIVVDPKTQNIYVSDQNNHTIRKLTRNKTVFICKGSTYNIADSCNNSRTDITITWKRKAPNGTYVNLLLPPTQRTDTATFVMEVKYKANCTNVVSDTIRVKYYQPDSTFRIIDPVPVFTQACFGDPITLAATPGYTEYQWFLTANNIDLPLFTSTQNSRTIQIDTSGFYKLVVFARNKATGCLDRLKAGFEKQLYLTPKLKADFTPSFICLGNTTQFNPVGTDPTITDYKWNFGVLNTLSDTSNQSVGQYQYSLSGTYNVQMIASDPTANNCPDTLTKPVIISSLPKLTLNINNTNLDSVKYCGGQVPTMNLKANFTPDVNTVSPFSFQWFSIGTSPSGLSIDTTKSTALANPVLPSNTNSALFGYAVFVRDGKKCESNKDTVFARISKQPKFRVDVNKNKICLGQPITLTAVDTTFPSSTASDNFYKWYLGGQQIPADSSKPILSYTPKISGAYTLIVKNRMTGCTGTFTSGVVDVVGFQVKINKVPNPALCTDPDSVSVSATISGNQVLPLQFSWTDTLTKKASASLSKSNEQNVKVFNDSTRTFRLYVTDNAGCFNFDTVTVKGTSRKIPVFKALLSKSKICRGETIMVSGVDQLLNPPKPQNYTYAWDSAGVALKVDPTKPDLLSLPIQDVAYRLTVTDKSNGCSDSFLSSQLVVVGFDLNIKPISDPVPCSTTDSVKLVPVITGKALIPYQTVLWTDSSGNPAKSIYNPTDTIATSFRDSTRVYKLFLKDAQGCFDSAFVKVKGSSLVKPRFGISLTKEAICLGDSVILTAIDSSKSPANQFSYFWSESGKIVNKDTTNPVFIAKPQVATSYDLRVLSKNSGCAVTLNSKPISVSGFKIAFDPVSPPAPCSITDQVPLTARAVGNAVLPYSQVLWTDSITGNVSSSIDNPNQFSVLSFRDSTRTYKFALKDNAGCSASGFIKVQGTSKIKPNFIASSSITGPICRGTQVTFSALDQNLPSSLSQYTYAWDSLGSVVNSNLNSSTIVKSPKNTVQYSIKIKSKNSGCDTLITLPSLVVNGFDISFTYDKPLTCFPDSAPITAVLDNNVSLKSILWTDAMTGQPSSALVPSNKLNVMVFRDIDRDYKLTVEDNSGCQKSRIISVKAPSPVPPDFDVVSGKDTGVCVASKVPVKIVVKNGVAPYKFTWKDQAGNSLPEVDLADPLNPVISATTASVGSSKTYFISMVDANACFPPVIETVQVTLYDMTLQIGGTQTKLCKSSSDPNPITDITVNPSGQAPNGFNFKWTNLTTNQPAGNSKDLGNVNSGGNYEVEVTNLFTSCVRKANIELQVLNSPQFYGISISKSSLCNNVPIDLRAVSFSGNKLSASDSVVYGWSVLNGANSISSNDSIATYFPDPSDTNSITFKFSAINRCSSNQAQNSTAKLIPGPVSKLYASVLETRTRKDVVFTNGSINSDSSNVLLFEDGFSSSLGAGSGQTFTQVYVMEGKFKTTLYTVNKNGCFSVDSVFVTVIDKQNIFIPNVFSPNAVQDENKTFRIFGQNLSPQDFTLSVYDRWGHLVFITTDLNKAMFVGWDGKDGGNESQMGVYTYAIKGQFNDGVVYEKTGTVTLLR